MAKLKSAKSDVKKFQKEIGSLKAKLKIAQKNVDTAKKTFEKKQSVFLKSLKAKVAAARTAGFSEGLTSATKKAAAKKKALRAAEISFEKGYTPKKSATKAAVKTRVTKKKVTKKTVKLSKSAKPKVAKKIVKKASKISKSPKLAAKTKKTTVKKTTTKRGRPGKLKQPAHLNEARQLQQKLFQPVNQEIELL